jgi:para-nitrobenzyl esterase
MPRRPGFGSLARALWAGALGLQLACGGGAEAPPTADPASRRSPPAGELVGFVGQYDSHVWLGIPFARPPLGELRWRAPQRLEPWPDLREALASGPICTQYASPFGGDDSAPEGSPVGEEDCLYLNVYAPRLDAKELPRPAALLPVMVWIHGGGNVIGTARSYDGGRLAATQQLVVVTIQYRLGPLGWFRNAALRAQGGSPEDRSGNYGTLDQIRALEWVRENIAAFGGDPARVTIFGESAGARNVFALLLSPRARGLYHRAIVQSGGTNTLEVHKAENFIDDPPPGAPNSSNEVLLWLLQEDGARDRAAAREELARMSAAEIARYLRGKTSRELLAAYATEDAVDLLDVPQVFRDGLVLPEGDPLQRIERPGGAAGVPVIFGTNRHENRLFLCVDRRQVRWLFGLVPWIRDEPNYLATGEHMSDMWKATGVDEPAAALRRAQGATVFAYRFDWDEEPSIFFTDLSQLLGAAHGFEIPFVFGHWDLGRRARVIFSDANEPGREELAAKMMSYWAQFAYAGTPGRGRAGDLPPWQPWDPRPDGEKLLVFDTQADGGIRMAGGTVSREDVIRAVDTDPRLPGQREKCAVYRQLASWSRGFSTEEYETAGSRGCAEYPYDGYPWPD